MRFVILIIGILLAASQVVSGTPQVLRNIPGAIWEREAELFPRADCKVYTVVSGDYCDFISSKNKITTTQLISFNAGLNCNTLAIGQRLCVTSGTLPPPTKPNPDGSCQAYKVASSDSCSAIAMKYSVTVDNIIAWNNAAKTYKWSSCSALQVGYNICVSSGKAPPVPVNPNLQCGPESSGNATCPLKACCSAFGFCGITADFCTTTISQSHPSGANPCLSNCFMPTLPSCNNSAKRSLGYYAGWANRRPCGAVGPDQIDLTGITHINFAFAVISTDFKISLSGDDAPLLKTLVSRKGEVSGLKVLIALGGWAFSEEDPTKDLFTAMIASSTNRATFISSVKSFLSTYGLDGIDIDFEYPGAIERDAPATDTPNLTVFFKELRAGLPSALISVATPAGYWFLKGFEINKIMDYVDWANMMSYDYHGQWDTNVTGQPSVANPHTSLLDMKDSALLYRRAGIDLADVNLGLAWYARTFHLTSASCGKYNCTMNGGGSAGECSTTSGYLTQFEVEDLPGNDQATLDTATQTYYFMHGSDLITFDEDKTWGAKKDFAGKTCFGGTFVWSFDQTTPAKDLEPEKPPTSSGSCTFHVTQFQKPNPATDPYEFTLTLFNPNHDIIGSVNHVVGKANTAVTLPTQLQDPLVLTAGNVDADPVKFTYKGTTFTTDDEAHCKMGAYDSGNRDGDCGFTCDYYPSCDRIVDLAEGVVKRLTSDAWVSEKICVRDPQGGPDGRICGRGYWKGDQHWEDANILEDIFNFMQVTGRTEYESILDKVTTPSIVEDYLDKCDDAGWGILMYLRLDAYYGLDQSDSATDSYLANEKLLYNFMDDHHDSKCGGGVFWDDGRDFKNTVTNGLFTVVSAMLALVNPDDSSYLINAKANWDWMLGSGLRDTDNLWFDGMHLTESGVCVVDGKVKYTYNQGLFISSGGVLYRLTGDTKYLDEAEKTLDAVISGMTVNGILKERACDGSSDCDNNAQLFKGCFMKHLMYYLNYAPDNRKFKYAGFLHAQSSGVEHNATNSNGDPGNIWYEPASSTNHFVVSAWTVSAGLAAHVAAAKWGACTP